ncbi:MAG: metallophosphoesterase [Candidatus Nanohaloarchaea archaeon]|nr:metallophosphoesterase [Candidatus Nanohaloarchaea archaeon]
MSEEIVNELLSEGYLVDPCAVDYIRASDVEIIKSSEETPEVIDRDFIDRVRSSSGENIETEEGDGDGEDSDDSTNGENRNKNDSEDRRTKVEVEKMFEGSMKSRDVEDFVQHFNDRYIRMKDLLSNRMELKDTVSLDRIDEYKGDSVSVIAMVSRKYRTDSGKWIVYLEDHSGDIKALVDDKEGERIVPDEVIGISGNVGEDIIFADQVVRPDVPISREVRGTEEEVHAVFVSDLHMGSSEFLGDRMEKLLEWINSGEKDIRYLFVVGDMVAGVGNYPGQKDELEVKDIFSQYEMFSDFVDRVDEDIQVLIIPGNHDYVRLAEPQPKLPREVCPDIYDKENVHWLSNPSTVKIHGFEGRGIRVLMYHGFSFDDHRDKIPELRKKGMDEPHHCMIDFIKRRHLAPTFGSCLLSPEERDYMVIDNIPDIFVMGHTHAVSSYSYKGINIISSGTMEAQTDFQKRRGFQPDPARIPVVNLKTRETQIKEV